MRTRSSINGVPITFRARYDPSALDSFSTRLVNFCTESTTASPAHTFATIEELAATVVACVTSLWDRLADSVERSLLLVLEFWEEPPWMAMDVDGGDEAAEPVPAERPVDALRVYETDAYKRYLETLLPIGSLVIPGMARTPYGYTAQNNLYILRYFLKRRIRAHVRVATVPMTPHF